MSSNIVRAAGAVAPCVAALTLLLACETSPSGPAGSDAGGDADREAPDGDADADADGDADAEDDPDAGEPVCPEGYVSGRGRVFRVDAPESFGIQELPCLAGDGTLEGYYAASIESSLAGQPSYEGARSDDNEFLYDRGDPRQDEVQAYYVVSHMVLWVVASLEPAEAYEDAIEVLRSDGVFLDYGRAEVESRQWCGTLTLGMQGVTGPRFNIDVAAHELGHHVVYALNRNLENSMLHEGLADYLAAAFTQDPVIEPSESEVLDRSVANDHRAPDDIMTRGEYCGMLLEIVEGGGLDEAYPGLVDTLDACLADGPAALEVPEQHWAGMILSAALWEIRDRIGEQALDLLLFEVLAGNDVADTGELADLLVEADADRGGENRETIRQAFASRGIGTDLGLGFRDMGYSTCP